MQRNDVRDAADAGTEEPRKSGSLLMQSLDSGVNSRPEYDYDSDTDSDSDSDAEYVHDIGHTIIEFKMEIDSATLREIYTLRAVPYRRMQAHQDPFSNLDSNERSIFTTEMPFFDNFKTQDPERILELLKIISNKQQLKIENTTYKSEFHAVIGGWLGISYFPNDSIRQFTKNEYHKINEFISYVDLVLNRKAHLKGAELEAEFQRQAETYGITLDNVDKFKLDILLSQHRKSQHVDELKRFMEKKHEILKPAQAASPGKAMWDYVQGTMNWLYQIMPNILSNTEAAQPVNPFLHDTGVHSERNKERADIIARLRAGKYVNFADQRRDLKRLFELRPYFEPSETDENRKMLFAHEMSEFWHGIDKSECWQDPAVMAKARSLMIEAILISDMILADMERFLRQAGEEPTANNMACLLANQDFSFCRSFIYSGVIDFYPQLREKGFLKLISGMLMNDQPEYSHHKAPRDETDVQFFAEGSPENVMRKLYNTFIKQGFNRRYGKEENGSNDFQARLDGLDHRFTIWSTQDSKVQRAAPESTMEYLQRSISGGKQQTTEELTYIHPAGSTRPT